VNEEQYARAAYLLVTISNRASLRLRRGFLSVIQNEDPTRKCSGQRTYTSATCCTAVGSRIFPRSCVSSAAVSELLVAEDSDRLNYVSLYERAASNRPFFAERQSKRCIPR
jgi:hypothetical protein